MLVLGQGSLTPPGAPAPMMKTLDQIEPRMTLGTPGQTNTATLTIKAPGSYVLMGPVQVGSGDGIAIAASNVTLDLNGFTISSSANPRSGTGITSVGAQTSITIFNGKVASTRSDDPGGYRLPADTVGFNSGIVIGNLNAVPGSYVYQVATGAFPGTGIRAERVEKSAVVLGAEYGIVGSLVRECSLSYFSAFGIQAAKVADCTLGWGYSANGAAISGSLVEGCTLSLDGGRGINADLVTNCHVTTVGGARDATAITARIAIGCVIGQPTSPFRDNSTITHRYNMP